MRPSAASAFATDAGETCERISRVYTHGNDAFSHVIFVKPKDLSKNGLQWLKQISDIQWAWATIENDSIVVSRVVMVKSLRFNAVPLG